MGRRLVLVVLVSLAAAPAPASAAALRNNAGELQYFASSGEVNQLVVTRSGGDVVFTDTGGVAVHSTPPCIVPNANQPHVATCPAAGATRIYVDVSDGSDSVDNQVPVLESTLVGDTGRDTLSGSDGPDFLVGGDETDTLRGRGAGDFLVGEANADSGPTEFEELSGGDGDDQLQGGPGKDDLVGGEGSDTVDYLDRDVGVSVTLGNRAADDGEPGEGDAVNLADSSVEHILGGRGNDTLVGDAGNNRITGRLGDDTIEGGDGVDLLFGDEGNDYVKGGPNPPSFPGFEEVQGGPGNDRLDGGPGDDSILGGDGVDFLDYTARTAPVSVTLGDGLANEGEAGENDVVNVGSFDTVEDAGTGSGNDVLIGSDGNNILDGGSGDDRIDGLNGRDEISGREGNDDLTGGDEGDFIFGQQGDDVFRARDGFRDEGDCGEGADVVYADLADVFPAACESITRRFAFPLLLPRSIRLSRSGVLPLRVGCPDGVAGRCAGSIRVASAGRISIAGRRRTVAFAGKRFRIEPGRRTTVRLRLSSRNRALVKRLARVRVRVTISGSDAHGRLRTLKRTLTLLAPRR
jgi:Ca2+-binding RTX toxin-like protein